MSQDSSIFKYGIVEDRHNPNRGIKRGVHGQGTGKKNTAYEKGGRIY